MKSDTPPAPHAKIRRAVNGWLSAFFQDPSSVSERHLRGLGPVAELERALAARLRKRHAIAFTNATTALLATAVACDLFDSEIIVPEVAWGGTWAPFGLLRNRPVRVPVLSRSRNIDPKAVGRAITPATRAVLATDYSSPHDTHAIRKICDEHGVLYIADAARSFGLTRRGIPASSLADVAILSFGPSKRVSAVEGGAIVTDDSSIYERVLATSQHPARYRREFSLVRAHDRQPLNGRIHPIAALLVMAQIC